MFLSHPQDRRRVGHCLDAIDVRSEDIAPYVTQGEYERLSSASRISSFTPDTSVAGSCGICLAGCRYSRSTRDPVERAISEYFWIKEHYRQQLETNPNAPKIKNYMMDAGKAVPEHGRDGSIRDGYAGNAALLPRPGPAPVCPPPGRG